MAVPTVSIILPTYNRSHLVGRAIQSVLEQTFKDWELIVVDDASSDNTERVVRGFSDPRIHYIKHQQNRGQSAARNTGIRNASSSQYLAYLDDDDEWLPEKLDRQLKKFQGGGEHLGVVGCGRLNYSNRKVTTVLPGVSGWIFEDLLADRVTGTSTQLLLVRRFASDHDVLFDENFPAFEERDYLLRICRRYQVDFVREPLVKIYRNHGGSHAANPRSAIEGYLLLMKKYAKELETRPEVKSYYHARIAREAATLGNMREVRNQLKQAIRVNISEVRNYLWLVASYMGEQGFRLFLRLSRATPPKRHAYQ